MFVKPATKIQMRAHTSYVYLKVKDLANTLQNKKCYTVLPQQKYLCINKMKKIA